MSGSPSQIGTKRCASDRHDEASTKFPKLMVDIIPVTNTRKISSTVKTFLETNWISSRSNRIAYVCGSCVKLATDKLRLNHSVPSASTATSQGTSFNNDSSESNFPKDDLNSRPEQPSALSVEDSVLFTIRSAISLIKSGKVSKELLVEIAAAIGEVESSAFARCVSLKSISDGKAALVEATYCNALKTYNCPVFSSFFEGICNSKSMSVENKLRADRHLVSAIHSVCMAVNSRFISPLSVAQNIVLHSYAGSRAVCQMFGAIQPSGSYSYLSNFVSELSLEKPTFPDGDIFIAFDNQQIIGRDFRVSPGNTQPTSTVTSFAVYQDEVDLRMQYQSINLEWPLADESKIMLWNKYLKFEAHCIAVHYKFRKEWIAARLKIVVGEMDTGDPSLDNPACVAAMNTDAYEAGLDYARVDKFKSSCSVYDMENLFINPNSYKTVESVLQSILEMNEASSPQRQWVTVICDGVPYNIATNLVRDIQECSACKSVGRNLKCQNTPGHLVDKKYRKIVMRPGAGHIELNLVRAIFHGFFDVFIQPIAIMLGFNTPRALEYCKKALDHHKSWQILQIIYVSLSDELMYQYVKRAKEARMETTVEGFYGWMSEQRWPNLQMASDFLFNVLNPLFLFRAGVRQCNDDVAMAGLEKASSLFYGFNHPKYRQLIARDTLYLQSLPEVGVGPAKRFGFCHKSSERGQGLDFLLEERNKLQKQWIFTHGVPTTEQWRKSSSTLTFFEKLKSGVLLDLGINEEGFSPRKIPLGEAYGLARSHFRNILNTESTQLSTFSLLPTPLPMKFLDWAITCKQNKQKYFQAFLNQEKCVLSLVDTTDLELLSFEDIKKKLSSKIRQLHGQIKEEMAEKLTKCDVNADLIDLLGEIDEEIASIDYSFV